jgi:hypothetical protein
VIANVFEKQVISERRAPLVSVPLNQEVAASPAAAFLERTLRRFASNRDPPLLLQNPNEHEQGEGRERIGVPSRMPVRHTLIVGTSLPPLISFDISRCFDRASLPVASRPFRSVVRILSSVQEEQIVRQ